MRFRRSFSGSLGWPLSGRRCCYGQLSGFSSVLSPIAPVLSRGVEAEFLGRQDFQESSPYPEAMTVHLKLICHASTAAQRAAVFPGDEPLDAKGLKALEAIKSVPIRVKACWTSPALRARQTAEILGLEAVSEPALREADYGRWTGHALSDIQREEPDALAAWLTDPAVSPHGGESLSALMNRVAAWVEGWSDQSGNIVAVTHASIIKAAIVHALGAPRASFWRIDVAPLSVARLSGNRGRWTLSAVGPMGDPPILRA